MWLPRVGYVSIWRTSLACEPGTSGGGGSSVSETESENTQAGATSTGSEPSLFDRLKAPMRSELTRNLSASSGHGNVSKKRPCCSTNPKSVTPSSRVREFPEGFCRGVVLSVGFVERNFLQNVASLPITLHPPSISTVN